LPTDGYWEDLCFNAQQCAEQAIKAVFIQHGWPFALIHDLGLLLDDLKLRGLSIPPEVEKADQLNPYAAQTRYPAFLAPVNEVNYREAILIAENVLTWAESLIP
jgi:HEPN domain-containing protein